jgi:hypothetical protein
VFGTLDLGFGVWALGFVNAAEDFAAARDFSDPSVAVAEA